MNTINFRRLAALAVSFLLSQNPSAKAEDRVDFSKQIRPILSRNCFACHRENEAEGGLVLENIAAMRKGGDSGPGIAAKDPQNSLVLSRAMSTDEPMPPDKNSVGAKRLTAEELALLKQWIEQGAEGVDTVASEPIDWKPIPESIRSTYASAISPDDRLAAFGRANRVSVVDLISKAVVTELVDPSLDTEPLKLGPVADVDLVQSIAFSPDGNTIATGGFRTVRLWQKRFDAIPLDDTPMVHAAGLVATSADGKNVAVVNAVGDVDLYDGANNKLQSLSGHDQRIIGLAWTVDASRITIADETGRISVWNASDGKLLAEMNAEKEFRDVAIATDGSLLAAITGDGTIHLFRVDTSSETAKIERTLDSVGAITDATAIAIASQAPPLIIAASQTAGVSIVQSADNQVLRKLDHGGIVDALAVSRDSTRIVTGGRNGIAKVWNTSDGALAATLTGSPELRLSTAAATRDVARQKAQVAALNAKTAVLQETLKKEDEALAKAKEVREKAAAALAEMEKKRVDAVALVAATEAFMAKAMKDTELADQTMPAVMKTVEIGEATAQKLAKEIEQLEASLAAKKTEKATTDAAVAKAKADAEAAKKLAADSKAAIEKATKDLEAQKKAATAAGEAKKSSETELANRQQALDAATSARALAEAAVPAHQTLIATATRMQTTDDLRLADLTNQSTAAERRVIAVGFDTDAKRVAVLRPANILTGYDLATSAPLFEYALPGLSSTSEFQFLDDNVCGYSTSGGVVCRAATPRWVLQRTIGDINGGPLADRVTALQFHRDGMSLAVGGGLPSRSGEVMIFAVDTGAMLRNFTDIHSDTVLDLAYSPDGRTLAAAAADKTISLLDVAAGSVRRILEGHTHHVLSIAWKDDGQTLASASADTSVKVWDTLTGEVSRTISGFPKEVTAIEFVAATGQVIVACGNGQVRLAETSNGSTVRNFDASGNFLFTSSLTTDGTKVLAGGESGVVKVWNVADAAILADFP